MNNLEHAKRMLEYSQRQQERINAAQDWEIGTVIAGYARELARLWESGKLTHDQMRDMTQRMVQLAGELPHAAGTVIPDSPDSP